MTTKYRDQYRDHTLTNAERIDNYLACMRLCTMLALDGISDGDHEKARREAKWAARFANRALALIAQAPTSH